MRVKHHAALSVGVAALTYLGTRSIPAAAAAGLTGVLVDLDHFPTLIRRGFNRSRRQENPFRSLWHLATMDNRELSGHYRMTFPAVYTPGHFLHQIEIVPLIPIAVFVAGHTYAATGLAVGIVSHLIADIIANRPPIQSISLIARLSSRNR